jgi:23S rRNA (guanosine2251-2'-O)-methyltransferase
MRNSRPHSKKTPTRKQPFNGKQRDRVQKPSGGDKWIDIPKHWRTVVGTHAIREAVAVHANHIEQIWLRQGWETSQELKDLQKDFKSRGLKVEEKPVGILDKIMASHQGAAVFLSKTPNADWAQINQNSKSMVLLLDGIEDPHNLGAILRTSWLMGVDALMIPEERSVGLTSTVHKVACGGAEHVPVERFTNFSNHIESLKKDGYWVFGLSHEGKRSLLDLELPEKVVWCIGAEDKGLRTTTERLCDELVRIPQVSAAASYNASVAAAIALTETFRQQTVKKV